MATATKRERRNFTAEQKATIVRRHLSDKVPVSDLCDEYGIQPSMFYQWQRQALENLEQAISAKGERGRAISIALCVATIAMPGGFALGGAWYYEGDPGVGTAFVPIGAAALIYACVRMWSASRA